MNCNKSKSGFLRVPITMSADMIEYLGKISLKAKVTGGRKLAITEIVRACLKAFMEIEVDVSGVKDEEMLVTRILQAESSGQGRESEGIRQGNNLQEEIQRRLLKKVNGE